MTKKNIKKQPKYKVTATWWVGWVVLTPIRVWFMLCGLMINVCSPSCYFGILNSKNCTDQSKWKL